MVLLALLMLQLGTEYLTKFFYLGLHFTLSSAMK